MNVISGPVFDSYPPFGILDNPENKTSESPFEDSVNQSINQSTPRLISSVFQILERVSQASCSFALLHRGDKRRQECVLCGNGMSS
jgi:hypothetical protein